MKKNKNLNSVSRQIVFILIFAFIGISAIAQKQSAIVTDPLLIPYRQGDKWGLCTKDKNIVIPCEYDVTWNFSEGLALVMLNSKWGYIDKTGKQVVSCLYDDVWISSDGLIEVSIYGKSREYTFGLFDKTGKELIPCYCDEITKFKGDWASWVKVKMAGKWAGFMDTKTGTQYWEN